MYIYIYIAKDSELSTQREGGTLSGSARPSPAELAAGATQAQARVGTQATANAQVAGGCASKATGTNSHKCSP